IAGHSPRVHHPPTALRSRTEGYRGYPRIGTLIGRNRRPSRHRRRPNPGIGEGNWPVAKGRDDKVSTTNSPWGEYDLYQGMLVSGYVVSEYVVSEYVVSGYAFRHTVNVCVTNAPLGAGFWRCSFTTGNKVGKTKNDDHHSVSPRQALFCRKGGLRPGMRWRTPPRDASVRRVR